MCAPGRWPNYAAPTGDAVGLVWDVLCRLYDQRAAVERGDSTFLYVVREHTGLVKIGVARDPVARLLNLQVAHPYPLKLVGTVPATVALERFIQRAFRAERIRGEWFHVSARLDAFLALLESANEIQRDMAQDGDEIGPLDTVACLLAPVEDALIELQRAEA